MTAEPTANHHKTNPTDFSQSQLQDKAMTDLQATAAVRTRPPHLVRRSWIAKSSLHAMAVMLATPALAQAGPAAPAPAPVVMDGQDKTGIVVSNNPTLSANSNVVTGAQAIGLADQQTVFTNYRTKGGDGSGGGAGLGGVFFVDAGANLTLNNVSFSGNTAVGGEGGGIGTSSVSPFEQRVAATTSDASATKLALPNLTFGTLSNNDPRSTGLLVNALTLENFKITGGANAQLGLGQAVYLGTDMSDPAIITGITTAGNVTTYQIKAVGGGQYIVPESQLFIAKKDTRVGYEERYNAQGFVTGSTVIPGTMFCATKNGNQLCGSIADISYASKGNVDSFNVPGANLSSPDTISVPNFNSVQATRFKYVDDNGAPVGTTQTISTAGTIARFEVGMIVTGDGIPAGTTITKVDSANMTIMVSNPVNLANVQSFKAGFSPLLANSANSATIQLTNLTGVAVGQKITGAGIAANTTITAINTANNSITINSGITGDGLTALDVAGGFQVAIDPVVAAGNRQVTVASIDNLMIGTVLVGTGVPDNAVIIGIDPVTKVVSYDVDPRVANMVKGGSLNNLISTANAAIDVTNANGGNGLYGSVSNALLGDGEGTKGTNAGNGKPTVGGAGGNGGVGGGGSFGSPINPQLTIAYVLDGLALVAATAEVLGPLSDVPPDIGTSVSNLPAVGLAFAAIANDVVQGVASVIDTALGFRGIGGDGGAGGSGANGSEFFGGGAGGKGGKGGESAVGTTDGGSGGDGGAGGRGGFGAGGGAGGEAGLGGSTGNSQNGGDGSGGLGGFGGGTGASGYAGGGDGGSGYGGAIFVRRNGTLTITGNALFENNSVSGGSSSKEGVAGQAAGADLFMMKGSSVTLKPGIGNTITFLGGIADDSTASIEGAANASGNGAGLTIGGGGLVQFFGENTYTGATTLTGATLQADQGVGLHPNSRLQFQGAGTISSPGSIDETNAPVLLTSGTFTRSVGAGATNVAWAGSGGFAATAGGLTVSLGQRNGQPAGLTWGANNFMLPYTTNGGSVPSTLVFGSAAPDATGEVRFLNAINLAGTTGRIAVFDNKGSDADRVVMSGAISNGPLIVNDANYTGSLYLTGQNALTGIVVQSGLVSTLDGATVGRLMTPAGGSVFVSGGTLLLGGAETLTGVVVGQPGTLDARGAITAGDIVNAGTILFAAPSSTGMIANAGTFTAAQIVTTGDIMNGTTGVMTFANGVRATKNNGTIMNAGTFNIGGGSSVATNVVNASNAGNVPVFNQFGALTVSGDVANLGAYALGADLSAKNGTVFNSGLLTVYGNLSNGIETATTRTIDAKNFAGGSAGQIALSGGNGLTANTLVISQTGTNSYLGTVTGAGNLVVTGGGALTLGGVLSQTGGLRVQQGSVTLTAADTFGGQALIDPNGTLNLSGAGSVSQASSVAANGVFDVSGVAGGTTAIRSLSGIGTVQLGGTTLQLTQAADVFSGRINGIGGLTVAAGTEQLSGANGYSGTTAIQQGATLALVGAGTIANSSVVADGTLAIDASTGGASIGTLSGSAAGRVTLGAQTLTVNGPGTGDFAGVIGGSGSFVVAGGGQILEGVNTYTGRTVVNANAGLGLVGTGSIAASSGVTANGLFTIQGTTAGASIASLSGDGMVGLGAQTLTLTNAADTFAGMIAGSGGLTVTGGSEQLSSQNFYTGRTTIGSGATLGLTDAGSIATSSGVTANGTFAIGGAAGGVTIASLAGTGAVTLGNNGLTLSAAADRFDGVISGAGGLTVAGGTETLSAAQTYTGATTIANGASLVLAGQGSLANSGVRTDGVLDLSGAANASLASLAGTGQVALGANTLTLTNAADRFDGVIAGTGGLTIARGTETLGGVNLYTGRTTVAGGATLALAGNGSIAASAGASIAGTLDLTAAVGNVGLKQLDGTGGVTLGNGMLVIGAASGTFSGTVSGAGGLAIVGGQMALTGTNSYAGGTIVSNAGLTVASDRSLGAADGALVLQDATLTFGGATTGTRTTTLGGVDTINTGGNAVVLNGAIGGTGALAATGGGSLTLGATNTYAGGTSVNGGTILRIGSDAALGTAASALLLQNGTLQATANLTSARDVLVAGPSRIDGNGFQVGLTGTIYGQSGNAYTAIATGGLRLTGALALDPNSFTVTQGALLRGTGTFNRAVTVAGTLAPGNSPGTMTFNAPVTIAPTGTLSIDIDGTGTGTGAGNYSRIVLTGTNAFTAGGTLTPVLRGITGAATNTFTPTLGQTFAVVETNVAVNGAFAAITQPTAGLTPGTRLDAFYGNNVTLVVTPSDYTNLGAFPGGGVVLTDNQAAVGASINALRGAPGSATSGQTADILRSIYGLRTAADVATLETQLAGEVYTDAARAAAARSTAFGETVDFQTEAGLRGGGVLWLAGYNRGYDFGTSADRPTYGLAGGVGVQVGSGGIVGVAGGYDSGKLTFRGSNSAADVKLVHLTGYAGWTGERFFARAQAGATRTDIDANRSISLLNLSARGSGKGWGFTGSGEVGYTAKLGGWILQPSLLARVSRIRFGSITETGAGPVSLDIDEPKYNEAFGVANLRIGHEIALNDGWGVLRPVLDVGYQRELDDRSATIVTRFTGAPGTPTTITSVANGHDALRVGAGVSLATTSGFSVSLRGDLNTQRNIESRSISLGAGWHW